MNVVVGRMLGAFRHCRRRSRRGRPCWYLRRGGCGLRNGQRGPCRGNGCTGRWSRRCDRNPWRRWWRRNTASPQIPRLRGSAAAAAVLGRRGRGSKERCGDCKWRDSENQPMKPTDRIVFASHWSAKGYVTVKIGRENGARCATRISRAMQVPTGAPEGSSTIAEASGASFVS